MCFARPSESGCASGFTLVEMAVVIAIAGLLLSSLLPALLESRRSAQLAATQTNMQSLLRAVAAYAHAYGCLPCPTPGNKISGASGGLVGTAGNTACGVCAVGDGTAPFAALGIDPATARDGWGRWLTYAVDTALTQRACSDTDIAGGKTGCAAADKMLCLANFPSATSPTINFRGSNTQAAVVIISHGANGYGAYRPQPRAASSACQNTRLDFPAGAVCSRASTVELCNDKCRVAENSYYAVERGENFDDIVTFIGRNALVSLFGSSVCTSQSGGAP